MMSESEQTLGGSEQSPSGSQAASDPTSSAEAAPRQVETTTMRLSAIGTPEAAPTPSEQSSPGIDPNITASLRPGTALLRVDHGPNAGARFLLDAEVTTVGRHPHSDIFLDDVTVSRKHAQFTRDDRGAFSVKDVGSLNGTYLNKDRIDVETGLSTGDEVQIGKFRLVVHLASPGDLG